MSVDRDTRALPNRGCGFFFICEASLLVMKSISQPRYIRMIISLLSVRNFI